MKCALRARLTGNGGEAFQMNFLLHKCLAGPSASCVLCVLFASKPEWWNIKRLSLGNKLLCKQTHTDMAAPKKGTFKVRCQIFLLTCTLPGWLGNIINKPCTTHTTLAMYLGLAAHKWEPRTTLTWYRLMRPSISNKAMIESLLINWQSIKTTVSGQLPGDKTSNGSEQKCKQMLKSLADCSNLWEPCAYNSKILTIWVLLHLKAELVLEWATVYCLMGAQFGWNCDHDLEF